MSQTYSAVMHRAFELIKAEIHPIEIQLGPWRQNPTKHEPFRNGHDVIFDGKEYFLSNSVATAMVEPMGHLIVEAFIYDPNSMGTHHREYCQRIIKQYEEKIKNEQ